MAKEAYKTDIKRIMEIIKSTMEIIKSTMDSVNLDKKRIMDIETGLSDLRSQSNRSLFLTGTKDEQSNCNVQLSYVKETHTIKAILGNHQKEIGLYQIRSSNKPRYVPPLVYTDILERIDDVINVCRDSLFGNPVDDVNRESQSEGSKNNDVSLDGNSEAQNEHANEMSNEAQSKLVAIFAHVDKLMTAFKESLNTSFGALELSSVMKAALSNYVKHNEDAASSEMNLQQSLYAPFSHMLIATSGANYQTDEKVYSSLHVQVKEKSNDQNFVQGSLTMMPDAIACALKGRDCFGMMELKFKDSESKENLVDYDKCVLMTAATAIALHSCIKENQKKKIMIPFIIGTKTYIRLYITSIDNDGLPHVSAVQTNQNGAPLCNAGSHIQTTRCLIAFALLLNDMKKTFPVKFMEDNYLNKFSTPAEDGKTIFSSVTGNKRVVERNQGGGEGGIIKRPKNVEGFGKEAASCSGLFQNIEHPFLRQFLMTDKDLIITNYQTRSPFYFKGKSKEGTDVFLKVYEIDNEKKADLAKGEWELQWHAHDKHVPVACPLFKELVKSQDSNGTLYLVMAMEILGNDKIDSLEELLRFALSLIRAVSSLHKDAGILHGDLKPSNVRWSNGMVKLIDFGNAQWESKAQWLPGTEGYEAPEVESKQCVTRMSDAFSIGKTINCFIGNSARWDDSGTKGGYRIVLDDLVKKLTAVDPADRMTLSRAKEVLSKALGRNIFTSVCSRVSSPPRKIAKVVSRSKTEMVSPRSKIDSTTSD
eukprot:CAMPEP_0118719940 /NCGR_PEP_ID=MMETSP0800-20121206/29813_1 /TAXON_ID=210618 ORGANISM="Striatella unipunctata, Strain CCMP2910" /NCGR_SAMPLE_ID=MMETSP0800 /ASSEMBLY_ACC=CAM_ASM_000638 /LENGTH=760 /DNA_ID=CAMNT_0006627483 /DNA_START=71 /DNA_END=2353 /DNA_ORIENTATION=-